MKNQGISLIALIITIIVIIILAAIVIFNGLSTPNSANFAKFTQSVDNVSMAVLNRYAKLLERHGISGDSRTQEQVYLEIATAKDSGINQYMGTSDDGLKSKASESTGVQHIDQNKSNEGSNPYSIGMKLPKVREYDNGWYVTSDGIVFNANGYEYDKKTYFTGAYYMEKQVDTENDQDKLDKRAKNIANILSGDSSNNKLSGDVVMDGIDE